MYFINILQDNLRCTFIAQSGKLVPSSRMKRFCYNYELIENIENKAYKL